MTPERGVEVRPIGRDELAAFVATMSGPFFQATSGADFDRRVESVAAILDLERTACAFVGDLMIGTAAAFSLEMSIPGGVVPVGGTTMVSVQPTHRRRGVLGMMMEAHLADVRERGESVAALWASDSAIYGRFGFGMASVMTGTTIDRAHVRLHRRAPIGDPVRLVPPEDVPRVARPLFDSVMAVRPGMFARTDAWWNRWREDPERGGDKRRAALTERDGQITGYVDYRVETGGWERHHGDATIHVNEIIAIDGPAASGLWGFILTHDLVAKIQAFGLPIDDPLFSLLEGSRRATPVVLDQLFVRLIDVPAAFDDRRYATDGRVSFRLHDPGGSHSTFVLTAEDGAGSCSRWDGEPDLEMTGEEIGSAYLGRSRIASLLRAGRVSGSVDAARHLDRILAWDPEPWCQQVF